MTWDPNDLKNRMQKARKKSGLGQDAFAQAIRKTSSLAVTGDSVFNWEKRGNLPTLPEIHAVASFTNISPCWLAFGEGVADPVAMERAFEHSRRFEADKDLAHLADAYAEADEKHRQLLMSAAAIITEAPQISSPPTTPVSAVPESSEIRLTAEEALQISVLLSKPHAPADSQRALAFAERLVQQVNAQKIRGPNSDRGETTSNNGPTDATHEQNHQT